LNKFISTRKFSSVKNNYKFFQDHPLFQYWHKKKDTGHENFVKESSTIAELKPKFKV